LLNEKYGLDVETRHYHVRYRFRGGEQKIATLRDVLPVGIGSENGEVSSHRIPDSSTKLLLSLKTQKALGKVLDLPAGTADFRVLGLYGAKLRRTSKAAGAYASPTARRAVSGSRRRSTRRRW
jgi:hypothetical protein